MTPETLDLAAQVDGLKAEITHWQENCQNARAKVGELSARLTVARADATIQDEAIAELVAGMRRLYRGYVSARENGRDRIVMLGGDCDPVDRMEEGDPVLREMRGLITKHQVKP